MTVKSNKRKAVRRARREIHAGVLRAEKPSVKADDSQSKDSIDGL